MDAMMGLQGMGMGMPGMGMPGMGMPGMGMPGMEGMGMPGLQIPEGASEEGPFPGRGVRPVGGGRTFALPGCIHDLVLTLA